MKRDQDRVVERRLRRLNGAVVAGFGLVAVALLYWSVWQAEALGLRDDNPRRVTAELAIERGPIYDRNGRLLAITERSETGLVRRYPLAAAGGPTIGHYSFRHGTAGVEEGADSTLRGDAAGFWESYWRQTLHRPQIGKPVRLTLDAAWQTEAMSLLDGQRGAVVLLSLPDGGVRVMASAPSYDPNRLDEAFERLATDENAPLLNRATQGQYQPGALLAPLLAAWSVSLGAVDLASPLQGADEPLFLDEAVLRCQESVAIPATIAKGLAAGCPAATLAAADRLGAADVSAAWSAFSLTEAPQLVIPAEASPPVDEIDLRRAKLGQESMLVSPLQLAVAWAALAEGGSVLRPILLLPDETESPVEGARGETAVSPAAAEIVLAALERSEGVISFAPLVLSGPGGRTNSWFVGLAPAEDPRFIVVVVVEDTAERQAPAIGRALLSLALSN